MNSVENLVDLVLINRKFSRFVNDKGIQRVCHSEGNEPFQKNLIDFSHQIFPIDLKNAPIKDGFYSI